MPIWAVAISIVATSLSAVTFIGAPQQSYSGDLTYLATNIGMVLAALLIAFVFIPKFYKSQSSSIYDLLERRFDTRARKAASITFLAGRVLASGARVYVGAMPASILIFGLDRGLDPNNLMLTIGALAIVATLYTLAGGISSVIWSDVIQYLILVGAAVVAIVLIAASFTAPMSEIIDALRTGTENQTSKLTVIDPSFDFKQPFTLPACIIGFTLLGIGSYGTDQDLAQRMLTCKSAKHGARSVIGGILLGIPTAALFLVVGLGLWIIYQRPELTNSNASRTGDDVKVFLDYIMTEIPAGVRGLMMAGLFAAGLSSMNSAINSMGAAFVEDLYKPIRPNQTPKHYVTIGRVAVAIAGIALALCAVGCIFWNKSSGDTLINFALGTMAFAYAGLVAVFFTALFTKRGSSDTTILALIIGFLWMLFSQPVILNALSAGNLESPLTHYADYHFTWKLTIGVGLSMLVCMIGSPKTQPS